MRSDFRKDQLQKWEEFLHGIFLDGIPQQHEWTETTEIIGILEKIGHANALNHTFIPFRGGMDLTGARQSYEQGCVEMYLCGFPYILKISKVKFQSFNEAPLEWAHFRVVTVPLKPSGVYEKSESNLEELTEITPGDYIDLKYYENGEFQGESLSQSARSLVRLFSGDFVVFSKGSLYNDNPYTYDGRHSKFGEEWFLMYLRNEILQTTN